MKKGTNTKRRYMERGHTWKKTNREGTNTERRHTQREDKYGEDTSTEWGQT